MSYHKPELTPADPLIRIVVLGTGHVGLPTALGFAEMGWTVVGADKNHTKIDRLLAGRSPFYEPRIQALLEKHLASGRVRFTPKVEEAIREGSVLFICVGTP